MFIVLIKWIIYSLKKLSFQDIYKHRNSGTLSKARTTLIILNFSNFCLNKTFKNDSMNVLDEIITSCKKERYDYGNTTSPWICTLSKSVEIYFV